MPRDPVKAEETRQKMRGARKLRLPASQETRKKLSDARKGKSNSEETRKRMREAWKYRLPVSQETRKKISDTLKGHLVSDETRQKLKGPRSKEIGDKISRSRAGRFLCLNSPNWKGGISFEPYCPKFNKKFKERVRAFFGYKCVKCGIPQTEYKLHVHHVNYDKMVCCNDVSPLFVILCKSCHAKTTSGDRGQWEQHFTQMITEKYDGKCYVT